MHSTHTCIVVYWPKLIQNDCLTSLCETWHNVCVNNMNIYFSITFTNMHQIHWLLASQTTILYVFAQACLTLHVNMLSLRYIYTLSLLYMYMYIYLQINIDREVYVYIHVYRQTYMSSLFPELQHKYTHRCLQILEHIWPWSVLNVYSNIHTLNIYNLYIVITYVMTIKASPWVLCLPGAWQERIWSWVCHKTASSTAPWAKWAASLSAASPSLAPYSHLRKKEK